MPSTSSPITRPRRSSLADRYRVLLEIGHTVTGTLGMEDLFRRIYRETSRVLDASGFYISIYDPSDDLATVVFYADQGVERHVRITYRGSDSEVIRSGEASTFDGEDGVESLMVLGDDESEITRSAVSAPMRYEGRVTGVVSAQSYQRHSYGPEDVELLQGIADMAAVAIENAQKVEELETRRREAMRIEEIGRAVVSSLEPREVLGKVVDAAVELVRCDSAAVWFLEEDQSATVEAWGGSASPSPSSKESWRLSQEAWGRLVRDREPLVGSDRDGRSVIPPAMLEPVGCRSVLVVPLVVEDEVVGGLSVGSRDPNAFSGHLEVLERLASQASVALENARLHASVQALSLTDPLTGLPNRRHLDIHLEREIHAARRGRSLAVVMFDLDNFKQYNDSLGHPAGDGILRAFAEILENESRSMNLIARFGGDEFVSVLSETPDEGVRVHAERVARRVQEHPGMKPHGISVSYGIATFDSTMDSAGDLIEAADESLYEVKEDRSASGSGRSPRPAAELEEQFEPEGALDGPAAD